jgi:pimeloyl-ACP methyl ester carboxylesterase
MPAGSRWPGPARGVPGHGPEPGPGSDDRGNPMTTAEGQPPAPGGTGGVLGGQSRWIDLGGPMHFLDFGGPPAGPVIVCVHGLGGSAVNWSAIAPLLTGTYRLLAPDLAGHGLTQSAGRGTDVASNTALLHRFIESVPAVCAGPGELVNPGNPAPPERPAGSAGPVRPVILMGNSMGGMISLLEAGAEPGAVAGLILIDPALPFVLARPDPVAASLFALYLLPGLNRMLISRRRSLPPEALVARVLSLCCEDVSRLPAGVVATHVEIARRRTAFPGTEQDFAVAMRSVLGQVRSPSYRRQLRRVSCPVLILHGARDRLVPVAAAIAVVRAHPSWSLVALPGVGHVPQLEAPQESARVITEWLGSGGRHAAALATPAHSPGAAGNLPAASLAC